MSLLNNQDILKWSQRPYWTNVYALGRTLLAIGTLITLLANEPGIVFRISKASDVTPVATSVSEFGIWCLLNPNLELARWISVAVVLWVISGWRPRYSGLLHWYVAFSYSTSATIVDGGDQITTLLTLFLVPLCLMDNRRNHWDAPKPVGDGLSSMMGGTIATFMYWTVRLQVALIYFEAAIGKMYVEEWINGTALYYWFTHPTFGASGWLREFIIWAFANNMVVAFTTWSILLLEVLLFMALFLDVRKRKYLLFAGIFFHFGIIVVHGLVSFFFAMSAALVLYLQPWHIPFVIPARLKMALPKWKLFARSEQPVVMKPGTATAQGVQSP